MSVHNFNPKPARASAFAFDANQILFHHACVTLPASITSRNRLTRRVPNSVPITRPPLSSLKTHSFTHPAFCKTPRVDSIFEIACAPFQFYAWIPTPFRSRVQLIRWQLLAAVDTRWEFCPAILVFPAGRITAAHVVTLRQRTMSKIARPRAWRFRAFRRDRPSSSQRFFERLQTPAAFIPGHVASHDPRNRDLRQRARACQSGRANPRRHFLPLATALARVSSCLQFANTEPVTSSVGWGCWIPWEKFDQQIKEPATAKQKIKNGANPWLMPSPPNRL